MKEQSRARICVPVCVGHARDVSPAVARAEELADVVELRLDCLAESELDAVCTELRAHARTKPLILTFRPAEQGGLRELSLEARAEFWLKHELARVGPQGAFDYADIELDLLESEYGQALVSRLAGGRVLCSYHDFAVLPDDLESLYGRMCRTPADVLKLAVAAQDVTDCLPLLSLLDRARREGRELIAVAMGPAGILTRILAPARGAFLTYGSLKAGQETAPGQPSAADLRDLYRLQQLDTQTSIMGLVGQPVMHSVSPHIHNAAFAASHTNAVYIPFEVSGLDGFMRRMVHPRTRELDWNLRGLSVTAPHKRAVMEHLDRVEPCALEIGAVNTVVISGPELHGYNTDAQAALVPLLSTVDLRKARVAVMGAGGAARALLWSLRRASARVTVFARDVEGASATAGQFGVDCAPLEGADFGGFEVVVNATPLGTRGMLENETPALAGQLRGVRVAYDLVYNPRVTRFMREALAAGCHAIGGMEMLVAQAAAQFKLWTGTEAPLEAMSEAGGKAVMSDE